MPLTVVLHSTQSADAGFGSGTSRKLVGAPGVVYARLVTRPPTNASASRGRLCRNTSAFIGPLRVMRRVTKIVSQSLRVGRLAHRTIRGALGRFGLHRFIRYLHFCLEQENLRGVAARGFCTVG
jgi:hypothetical protein